MAIKLSKYTQAQNIAPTDIINDTSPLSYKDWLLRNVGVLTGKENLQYENYVKQWYKDKSEEIPTATSIKTDYINLIKQLTIAFKTEADALWGSDINFDDPDELEQIIPFYASKLKEIAIYLINKREAIRRAKLKYNMTGTYPALERIFYEYLLKAFTKRPFPGNEYITNITDVSTLNTIPELSAVKSNFQITIEELYDDASYFDRDPSLPVSSYFTFNDSATAYLDNLNIAPADYEWLYTTGVTQLCADNPLLWSVDNVLNQYKNGIPLSAVELNDSDVLNDYNRINLTKKYIGEQQYIVSGGYWIPWVKDILFNIKSNNNWFYWLTGENIFENDTSYKIDPIALSATNLIDNNATAGADLSSSDIIFVSRNNSPTGAWLKLNNKYTFNATMSARLDTGKTAFAFPFPGFGLSGEDLEWTGRDISNLDQTFYYLNKDEQAAVYTMYWNSSVSSISSFASIYINDTNLIENGAYASNKFSDADFIVSRPNFRDSTPDYIYTDEQKYAWLYKMLNTDLPIRIGNNNIYWPYERYDTSIKISAPSNQCEFTTLSSIPISIFVGSVASNTINDADKIFKKMSPNATEYKEGAWLFGDVLPQPVGITNTTLMTGCYQPGLALKIYGGSFGSFVWMDDNIFADEVFNNKQHQDDCDYLKEHQFSLLNELPAQQKNLNYNQWYNCSCRAVIYSPLGHPGNTFDEYKGVADYIVAITSPTSSFNFRDWRGIDNKTYLESNEFGWFKLDNIYHVEPDIGWGSGNWVTNTGAPFMLSANVMYMYFRHNMLRDNADVNVPYLITRYKNNNVHTCWRKLILDKSTSQWIDAGVNTDMIIIPGDMITFDHNETYSIVLTSSHYEFETREVPIITDFNNFSLISNIGETNLPISSISIPIQAIDDNSTASNVILSTVGIISAEYYGMPTGNISISTSFINPLSNTSSIILSTITATLIDYYTYTSEATNFILNVPLYGWNYNTSVYDISSHGARPVWAEASDKDDVYTKGKSIDIWSGSPVLVDEYNFVTQPLFSNMLLEGNTYIEYNKRNPGSIIWKQPLTVTTEISTKKWCKLITNTNKNTNLSSVLYNDTNDIVSSATDIPSNIIFDIVQDNPLLINYYARNSFDWRQRLTNTSIGLPPTGGVWVSLISGNLVSPDAPYTNLTNRHYPTYASVPSISELYSTKDSGGYMIPHLLGVSTSLSKNNTNVLNTTNIDNDPSKRKLTAIYRDLNIYNSDTGLTKADQIEPVSALDIDSRWMKADVTEGYKAGQINHVKGCREFIPYQTQYECKGINDNGLFRQGLDIYDPWSGNLDDTWENDIDWPPNQRKQYNIEDWYAQQNNTDMQIYNWKTDIFGNQYAVLKSYNSMSSIYDKKHNTVGSLWTRNARNIVQPASASLNKVFEYIPQTLSANELLYNILDIDIWFDTMMIYTSSVLFFFPLSFDYDTGVIYSTSDDVNYIITNQSIFGGTWFHEDDKKVTICTLLSCGNQIRPILRSLNIETKELNYLYNKESTYTDMSNISLTGIEHPILTYDSISKTYNISYVGYGTIIEGMYFTTINITNIDNVYDITDARTLIPDNV